MITVLELTKEIISIWIARIFYELKKIYFLIQMYKEYVLRS
jgi:hypothetical protein